MAARPTPAATREDVLTAFRRDTLLAAARRVFGARGFDEATVDAIATEARVAKGTVYLYFPSKLAIYEAAFAAGLAELTGRTDARVRAAVTPRDAIHAFIDERVQYFQQNPDYFRMYVVEVGRQLTDLAPRRSGSRVAFTAHTRVLSDVLAAAVASGTVRDVDPAAAAMAVFDLTRGLVARRLLSRARTDAAPEVAFLTDLIWAGLSPAPTPAGPAA